MNEAILNIEIQEFINSNLNSEITKLLFKGSPFQQVSIQDITEQIESKNKCKNKLPTWFNTPNIYFPNKLNIEQTSSEVTANYKSSLVSGETLLDLTGGFGVDCFYFAKQVENVIHCDWNQELSAIVEHNFKILGVHNIKTQPSNGIEYMSLQVKPVDWIYIDPSRRHDSKGKVFFLSDCEPNVPEHLNLIFKHSNQVLIKTSPLLDIKAGLDELTYVKEIHCVAVENDMKELLWVLEKHYSGTIQVKTINLSTKGNQVFNFNLNELENLAPVFSEPKAYLYEPNAALLKSGAFSLISTKLGVEKLHRNSHLYTSDHLVNSFPGRTFRIQKAIPYTKNNLKNLQLEKANITTRNFPETVVSIRKKHKIKDGGETYLFFTTLENGTKIVLDCTKTVND